MPATAPAPDALALLCADAGSGLLPGNDAWLSAIWFTVPGRVYSKSNYRNAQGSSWKAVSSYEDVVHQLARGARPADWPSPDRDVAAVDRPVMSVVLAARTGLDAGNLSKSVLDACEGALYVTDAQVRCLTDLVVPAREDLGLFVAVAALTATTTPAQLLTAHAQLSAAAATLWDGTPA